MHPLTWQQAGQSDDKLREFFMPALVDLGASIMIQDAGLNYLFVTHLPEIWAVEHVRTPPISACSARRSGQSSRPSRTA